MKNTFSRKTASLPSKQLICNSGSPLPFGPTRSPGGWNFSIYIEEALDVELLLFKQGEALPLHRISLDPQNNRTGKLWHIEVESPLAEMEYLYYIRKSGSDFFALDPYAKAVTSRRRWNAHNDGKRIAYHPRAALISFEAFDWQGSSAPQIPAQDLILYEMHIRGFTQDPSSSVQHPGTFLGAIEKIPYLKSLGVNAVELMPIHEFDEGEYFDPQRPHLLNYWGYSPMNFFALMGRYCTSSQPLKQIEEFKTFVREMHKNGIEVILDVVFNHTGELDEEGPVISYKALAPRSYYLMDAQGKLLNYSGCGNTFRCNHPVSSQLIIDSLRYWVTEMHVDGFRFDLATILNRDSTGKPLDHSPLMDSITKDPLLAQTKLIAEPWDAGGFYQLGLFGALKERWMEWNGSYRDTVRRFINGTPDQMGQFATRLCGSQDLFGRGNHPAHSVNFITAHDGFTLHDLVSYNQKHNFDNGEGNRDGSADNWSWNGGAEGSTSHEAVLRVRDRQIRNFLFTLFISQGVPMLFMGDEYGHTKNGNNNTWCQDNRLNWFCWDLLEKEKGLHRFCQKLIQFRQQTPLLKRPSFLSQDDIEWWNIHGQRLDWSHSSPYFAFLLKDPDHREDLFILYNTSHHFINAALPPNENKNWSLVVDTAAPSPDDFIEKNERRAVGPTIEMASHSALLLRSSL